VIGPAGKPVDVLSGKEEQHIASDVAYAVWQYWRATGDDAFISRRARKWCWKRTLLVSRAVLEGDGRRHIRGVIGPDEYHEASTTTPTPTAWRAGTSGAHGPGRDDAGDLARGARRGWAECWASWRRGSDSTRRS